MSAIMDRCTLKQAMLMLYRVAKGVSDLAIRKLLHRDLKPANILVYNVKSLTSTEHLYCAFLHDFDTLADFDNTITGAGTIKYRHPISFYYTVRGMNPISALKN